MHVEVRRTVYTKGMFYLTVGKGDLSFYMPTQVRVQIICNLWQPIGITYARPSIEKNKASCCLRYTNARAGNILEVPDD